jgi:hypothetical protein
MLIEYRGLRWSAGSLTGDDRLATRLLAVLHRGATVRIAEPDGFRAIPPGASADDYPSVEAAFVLLAEEDGARGDLWFHVEPGDSDIEPEDPQTIH